MPRVSVSWGKEAEAKLDSIAPAVAERAPAQRRRDPAQHSAGQVRGQ